MIIRGKKQGEITFVCNVMGDTSSVYLVGSFNDWDPVKLPMAKNKDGSFRKKLTLKPGRYEYKFITDGIWLNDTESQENVMNPYGTLNSVLCI